MHVYAAQGKEGVSPASWLAGGDGGVLVVVVGLQQKSQLCVQERQKEGRGRASGGPPGMPVHIDTVGVSTTASAAALSPLHLLSAVALLNSPRLFSALLCFFLISFLPFSMFVFSAVICHCLRHLPAAGG